ncbi:cardiolipin synthase, partial [Candidatus Falkowbacteria bacterium]|nr:cardiolipin synthase [Candidatus Falkowbacteria bacterium]
MTWLLTIEIIYLLIVLLVIMRVLYDTRSGDKALAYILFIILLPGIGMLFYFSFGVNYRKHKLYSKKIVEDEVLLQKIKRHLRNYSEQMLQSAGLSREYNTLARFISNSTTSPLTGNDSVRLLLNGEEKFPEVLKALQGATSHIHIEYYIYENDETGNAIADVLIDKARQGVEVRFIYDDFGSHGLGKRFIKRLEDAGVETAPFYKIKWY